MGCCDTKVCFISGENIKTSKLRVLIQDMKGSKERDVKIFWPEIFVSDIFDVKSVK